MSDKKGFTLDSDTIKQLGLRPSDKRINAQLAPDARVFEHPAIAHVYVMESDLYGNSMPEGSCFLAFEGRSGLMGKHITIDRLRNSSIEEIRKMIDDNHEG